MDLSPDAAALARTGATGKRLENVELPVVDPNDFHGTAEPGSFDFVTTFGCIHDQAQPPRVLKGTHRALKAGGVYLMHDISGTSDVHEDAEHPIGPFSAPPPACIA